MVTMVAVNSWNLFSMDALNLFTVCCFFLPFFAHLLLDY